MSESPGRKPTIEGNGDEAPQVVVPRPPGGGQPGGPDALAVPTEAAILTVRDVVIFPGTVVPLAVAREKSRALINDVLPDQRVVVSLCQKNPETEDPGPEDLYEYGAAVAILRVLKMEDGNQGVVLHGLKRVRVQEWLQREPYLKARIEVLEDSGVGDTETEALMVNVRDLGRRVFDLSPNVPDEATSVLNNIEQPGPLADFLASNLQIDTPSRQELLAELDINERLRKVNVELQRQREILELSDKIQSQVKENIDQTQRKYFLQEQLKAIRKELGVSDEKDAEIEEYRRRIDEAGMPEEVQAEANRELERLRNVPSASPEYNIIRTYLDVMTELPWSVTTEDHLDIGRAREVLDEDHHDLEKVKRRILEYLAVRQLAPGSRGPILCFVGPPGVGKTSLGQSIARALGRKFIRMSLGGMRDEAELRGHRRTYVGALPGRIIQELRKAGTRNPVFMLDELDKVGQDFRGDPTSALLEILDPAQNSTFQDNYLNVPFDLSQVLFIGTANYLAPVPPALRDRMEVIELAGYTQPQKLQIARNYLVPRQRAENGLTERQAKWTDEGIARVIRDYTREPGVRELERQIGAVCRTLAAMIAEGKARSRKIGPKFVAEALGPRKYESELALRTSVPGVATGLAYTPTGGTIIFVEAAMYPGKGALQLTGQIGDIMRESAQAAYSLVRGRAKALGVDAERISGSDIHIHVPAGAVPKDGPSAGVAMVTALVTLLTDTPVRTDVAMTGEITLRGLVLPVGGIKEKVLAADLAGIREVILPERNRKDLQEVPEEVREKLTFHFARTVDDVLPVALGEKSSGGSGRRKKRTSKAQSAS